jgi:basic membrane protein A
VYSLFIVFILCAACMAGCRYSIGDTNAPQQPGTPIDREKVVIGVIHVGDTKSGYSLAHDIGVQEMQKALGLRDDQIIRKLNVNDADALMIESTMRECIDGGANVIIATSWGHMDICEKLAAEYPHVIFANASGYKYNDTNFTNYFGRMYQARYLSGIVAGLLTKTNKLGYVAAMDKTNSEVTGGLNAFALGVESVNPDARIYVRVTYSWFDPDGERQTARRLIEEGCDLIAQHCNNADPQKEAERAGVWGIGFNSDMSAEAPNAVLTSVVWKWGVYYTYLIGSVIDGSFTSAPYFGGLAEGIVDITPLNGALSTPEMETALAGARERILSGETGVFDGVIETNDGRSVGVKGSVLPDSEILGEIDWYYRNVVELK